MLAKFWQTCGFSGEAKAAVAASAGGCPSLPLFAFAFAAAALSSSRLAAFEVPAGATNVNTLEETVVSCSRMASDLLR